MIGAAAAAAVLTVLLAAPAHEDADQAVARARALLKDDKYEESLEAAATAADRHPDHAAARAALGDALYRRGDFVEAEASYKRALELNAEEASAHFGMGRILRTLGRYGDAAASFSRAAALSPESPKYLRVLANHLANRQDAIGMLKRYLALTRDHPGSSSNEEEAIVKNVEAWLALLEQMGERPLGEMVKSEPVTVPLQVLRGQAYLRLGVAGQKNLRFVFDTGATGFTISRRVAAKAKLVPIRPFTISGTGAARLETGDLVVVPEISLADAVVIRNVPATVRDAAGPEEGLIGPSSFAAFDITVDLKERRLMLEKPGAPGAPPAPAAQGRRGQVEPFRNVGGEIVIAGRVNGQPLNAMVDTGSAATIVARTALARVKDLVAVPAQWSPSPDSGSSAGIVGIGGALADRKAILKGTLTFAGRDYPAGGLVSSDLSGFCRSLEADIHVILGAPHLDDRAFTIDYRRMTVTFDEPAGTASQR